MGMFAVANNRTHAEHGSQANTEVLEKGHAMICMSKVVHWDHIVLLAISLSGDCRLGCGDWGDGRRSLGEAFLRGRRAPMSAASFGGRYAVPADGKDAPYEGWAEATPFSFLSAQIAEEKAKNAQREALDVLRNGYSDDSYNGAEWLEAIAAFAEDDVQLLCWTSATSGASIDCVRLESGNWVATYTQSGKASQYAALWAEMRDSALTAEEMEEKINPKPEVVVSDDNW